MSKNKRAILILLILSALLFVGPGAADATSEGFVSPSIPDVTEQQSSSSAFNSSDSIGEELAQGSIEWKVGWNIVNGSWFYADSINPVSLHSGWLDTNGAWFWLDPETRVMATGMLRLGDNAF